MTKCPNCKKPSTPEYTPFCCKRCADVDLGRWLNESYVVETTESPEDETQIQENDDSE
jgi:endogenous inhibitor of DNA gyrase (YacG/DUF329 family)